MNRAYVPPGKRKTQTHKINVNDEKAFPSLGHARNKNIEIKTGFANALIETDKPDVAVYEVNPGWVKICRQSNHIVQVHGPALPISNYRRKQTLKKQKSVEKMIMDILGRNQDTCKYVHACNLNYENTFNVDSESDSSSEHTDSENEVHDE